MAPTPGDPAEGPTVPAADAPPAGPATPAPDPEQRDAEEPEERVQGDPATPVRHPEEPREPEESDANCLFCRIVAGRVPSTEVLSTDQVYAFRDINPGAPVHVLLVPRTHVRDAAAVTSAHGAVLGALVEAAGQVAGAEGVAESGYRLVFNVGDDAGNTVGHLHLHLLGGRQLEWPPG